MFSRIASSAATLRSHGARLAVQSPRAAAAYSITAPRLTQDAVPTNDPTPRKPTPNVSETNAVPTSLEGVTIAEAPDAGEQARQLQAPNRATTWAPSQQPRELGMSGPRFEQTIMEAQVGQSLFFCFFLLRFIGVTFCVDGVLFSPVHMPPSS